MKYIVLILIILSAFSCTLTSNLARKDVYAGGSYANRKAAPAPKVDSATQGPLKVVDKNGDTLVVASAKDFTQDEKTGEEVRTVVANTVSVKARTRIVAERMGKVDLNFIVNLPKALQNTTYSVIVTPTLHRNNKDSEKLEELSVRGTMLTAVQSRDYWQMSRYRTWLTNMGVRDTTKLFAQQEKDFIKHPYPKGVRLDSIVTNKHEISYHYTQTVPVDGSSKKMQVTLSGEVKALDGSNYRLPSIDTLNYNISSMLWFIDTTSRYVTKIIDKYATIQARNHLNFKVNNTQIIDTLKGNAEQLETIKSKMWEIITQDQFIIDSIILTASSSPEGGYARNAQLAAERSKALAAYLYDAVDPGIDTLLTVRSIPEDWDELNRVLPSESLLKNAKEISEMIHKATLAKPSDYDNLETAIRSKYPQDYRHLRTYVYPNLRSVTFRYALRRKGMVKDTIHTTEPDTVYARGVEYLKERNYPKALYNLNSYRDLNTVIAMLSMGYDNEAYTLLNELPITAMQRYLLAVVCSRLGRYPQGKHYYKESCEMDEQYEFRGNQDPEINDLLKN